MTHLMTRRPVRVALILIGVAVGYFVTGRFILVLGAPPNDALATAWLPSGIGVAALILFGPVAAIGAFIGSLLLELQTGAPWAAGLVVSLAHAGGELLCYFLIAGRGGRHFSLLSTGHILRFVIAAGLGSAVSAFGGVSAYVIAGILPASIYWPTWLTWFGSMVIGIVLITPFLVSSPRDWPFPGSRQRYLEYAAVLAALAIAAFLWQGPVFSRSTDEPVILVVILVLLWIAFRFPPAAMTLAIFLFTISAVGGAVLRLRHIPSDAVAYSIFALQLMLGGLAAIGYLLDSLVTAQKRAAEALRADIGRRELAEAEINRLNAELEHKVEKRTRQLLEVQTELNAAQARYFSLYDLAPVGYCTVSAEEMILEANRTAENLLGVGRGELVMQPISRFIAGEDRESSRPLFGVTLAASGRSDEPQARELRMVKKDGTAFWVRIVASVAGDEDPGSEPVYRIVLGDITERKQAEAERERSERDSRNTQMLLHLVVDTIPVRLFWKDLNLVYLGCNRLFAQDAGYRNPGELVGTDDYSQVWSAQADLYRRDDFAVIASGKPRLNYEEPQDTPDGKRIWLSTSKVPIRDANDQIIGVLGTYEDITLRKLAAEEQLRNQKLAILGQLSGSVGHELRNPLGVMSNAVYFLKMVLADVDENVLEYLDIINKEIDTSLRIITDLLDFARTKEPQIQAVTARKLIEDSLGRCAIPENIAVEVDLAEDLPLLKVDPLQLGQVIQNLITNGIQAMSTGGSLTIRGTRDNEGMIGLKVTDTGEGISPENMEKLFQPLFTTKAKGIGLGLVVCKSLVEANGGRIGVKSVEGRETTFAVSLPVVERS